MGQLWHVTDVSGFTPGDTAFGRVVHHGEVRELGCLIQAQ